MTCTAASLQLLLLSPKDRNESALGGCVPCFLWQNLHFSSCFHTEAKRLLKSCLKCILTPDRCNHDRAFLGNGERNKVACVGGKQAQVATCFMHVELDCATFFSEMFFRLKTEQTQEWLDIYVDEKVILSCSRTSKKRTQAGGNSPDKEIYNGIKVLNFLGIEFSVCARDFLASSCKTEHWLLFRIIALVWQLLLRFRIFKFWVLKKVVLQTSKKSSDTKELLCRHGKPVT